MISSRFQSMVQDSEPYIRVHLWFHPLPVFVCVHPRFRCVCRFTVYRSEDCADKPCHPRNLSNLNPPRPSSHLPPLCPRCFGGSHSEPYIRVDRCICGSISSPRLSAFICGFINPGDQGVFGTQRLRGLRRSVAPGSEDCADKPCQPFYGRQGISPPSFLGSRNFASTVLYHACSLVRMAFTRSGCCLARSFCSPMSSFKL